MTLTELETYYADLLITQYRRMDKARDTIKLISDLSLCDGLMLTEPDCFNLDTAVGAQLTILGRIVGVPRNVLGLDLSHEFFQFVRYAGSPSGLIGFKRYVDAGNPNNLFSRYQSDATYTLSDFEMRYLIYLKIIYNNTWSSTKYYVDALWNIFGDYVSVIDNLDMTMTYHVLQPYQNVFIVAAFLGVLPRPMGVGVNVVYETAFLLDTNNEILRDTKGYPLYETT